jgi:hypothetical protein
MFQMHTAYSLELLVLGAGLALIYFGAKQASQILKIGGYILTVATMLNILCTLYYGIRYWEEGYFRTPNGKQCAMMDEQGAMMNGDMMKMMKGMKGQGNIANPNMPAANQAPNNDTSEQDHEAHHPD